MSTSISDKISAPSILAVELEKKQKFPTSNTLPEGIEGVTINQNGVTKNTIHFDREEDMIVLCLSAFVHDYVHDYNLGQMHSRVIRGGNVKRVKADQPSLFESLGIPIGNKIIKVMSYPIGGPRDINMYNDEQFSNIEKAIEASRNNVEFVPEGMTEEIIIGP
jgi:hypothetical protein